MASWIAPTTHATGDDFSVNDWNVAAGDLTFLYQRAYIQAYNNVQTSCPSGGYTQVTLGGLSFSGYGFSISSNNIIIPLAGIYLVMATATAGSNLGSGGNFTGVGIYQNGGLVLQGSQAVSYADFPASTVSGLLSCSVGDTVGLYYNNQSGSTLLTTTGATSTFISMLFAGSQ